MDESGVLKEIGLTESETKVYLALIDLGDSTRGEIVSKSHIAGSKIYEVLEKLHAKGLIQIYVSQGIKHFKAVNPKQLLRYLEDKKENISKAEDRISSILPFLLQRFVDSEEDQEVGLLDGLKGLDVLFHDQVDLLKKGDTCYVIGGTKGAGEESVYTFFRKIHVLRQQKGIHTRMLYNLAQKQIIESNYSHREFPLTETRYINHISPVAINIFKDRTAIIIFGKKITSIQIISQEVANSILEYFNMLWKQANS